MMRASYIVLAAAALGMASAPALAWGRGGGGFGGGGFDRGGGDFDRGGDFSRGDGGFDHWGGDSFGGDHGSEGWHQTATGTDYYHGANGVYRPPQVNDAGVYKPPAGAVGGTAYHPPAAAVGGDAYHPGGVAVGGDAYHPPEAAVGYRYPAGYDHYYPHGYYGYGYHPYYGWAAGGIVAATAVVGVSAAVLTTDALASPYPYGPIYAVPYYYGYAVPTVYTSNCGGWNQPICANPVQMFAQSTSDLTVAAGAIQAAAVAYMGQ